MGDASSSTINIIRAAWCGVQEYEPDAKPFDKATTLEELRALSSEEYGNALNFMRCVPWVQLYNDLTTFLPKFIPN